MESDLKPARARDGDLDIQSKLGRSVRECRHKLGITQEELGWRSNLHRTYIADIERGARNLTLNSIVNLARALRVTVRDLLASATLPAGKAPRMGPEGPPRGVGEILLIEDSATDTALTRRALKLAGFSNPFVAVRSAEEGLDYVFGRKPSASRQPRRPQLILLDLNLPRMSGLDFLRWIKADHRTRDIPVVVLTVSRTDQAIIECAQLGAQNYIVKPFGIDSLVRVTPKLNLRLTLAPPGRAASRRR